MRTADEIKVDSAEARQTARGLAADVRAGTRRPEDVSTACRQRIEAAEPRVGAWVAMDWDAVAHQIEALEARPDWRSLPLAGVPVAVKDVYDTRDFPTAYGSDIYAGHRPTVDAAAVALLRAAGAIVIGKTVSTEFAFWRPGATRNPLDPRRTPGGSSSGSAAAVAADMAPIALGTQTAASTIRPAAFCGVVGFKPTWGLISVAGVKALAHSVDTVGVFARDVADAALLAAVLADRPATADVKTPTSAPALRAAPTDEWSGVEPWAMDAFDAVVSALETAGARIDRTPPPAAFDGMADDHKTVMGHEAWRALATERLEHGHALSETLRDMLAEGARISGRRYQAALARRNRALSDIETLFAGCDVLCAPSAFGEAPPIEDGTGSPEMSRAWTLLGLPSITVPAGFGPSGLPIGLQLAARPGEDDLLLGAAAWVERVLTG